jgi:leucyl/phenylalanyl-tRNA--protein transferase
MIHLPWLSTEDLSFPDTSCALTEPNGLLAGGGDLSPARLLSAYRQGIFPWFNQGDPILWWSPNPRTVVFPSEFHIAKSLRKLLHSNRYRVSFDHCFTDVMHACAEPRNYTKDTWISSDIISGYSQLHHMGIAHSVEVWQDSNLIGGLYGIALGGVFFGESMFSRKDNASKVGFAHLIAHLKQRDFSVIDCQVASEHLFSLGAREISRSQFQQLLIEFTAAPQNEDWRNWPNAYA